MGRSRRSRILAKLAERDDRIAEYEHDPGNDAGEHWLHLRHPYVTDDGGSIHEYTVRDCLAAMASVRLGPTA